MADFVIQIPFEAYIYRVKISSSLINGNLSFGISNSCNIHKFQ